MHDFFVLLFVNNVDQDMAYAMTNWFLVLYKKIITFLYADIILSSPCDEKQTICRLAK